MVYHPKPLGPIISELQALFKFGYPCLTLKEGVQGQIRPHKKIPSPWFLVACLPSQTCRTNNKRVLSNCKFGYPQLPLKEGSQVKSDHTKRIPAHDFLYVGLPSQTSKTNNKWVISTFKFGYLRLTWKEGVQGQIRPHKKIPNSWFSIGWFSFQPLGPIISEL